MNSNVAFHIKPLDGVRGFAVLMVMFFHYNLVSYDTIFNGLSSIMKFGQTGVTLFFVLSGFLITRILIKAKQAGNYFKNFYIRRTLRIFPLYYFYLLITYFIFPFFNIGKFCSLNEQLPFYLFYQNFSLTFNWPNSGPNHYWSLAVEEHFYLFWPLIMYVFSIKNCFNILFVLVIIAVLTRWILLINGYGDFYFTFCRMDAIAIGCYIALVEYESDFCITINWSRHFFVFLVAISIFIYLWINFKEKSNMYIQIVKDIPYYYSYYLLLMLIVAKETSIIQNKIKFIFNNKFLVFSGKISFSLYVYHVVCYMIIGKLEIRNIFISLICCFILSYIVATISYYYFEMPFLKLKKKFSINLNN